MTLASITLSESLYVTQIRFCRALAVVRSLPIETKGLFQPSLTNKLNFYGLYKQAIAGDCILTRPSSKNIVPYAKWRAWNKMRGKSPIDAQILYINALVKLLQEFIEQFPRSEITEILNESLNYLIELEDEATDEEKWDTNDQENEGYYLGQTEQEQPLSEQYSYMSSPITSGFPITPQLLYSPHQYDTNSFYYKEDQLCSYENDIQFTDVSLSSKPKSELSIQMLQIEVAALYQKINLLQKSNPKSVFWWRWLWFFRSAAKHAFFNFLLLMIVFLVLWRRKSPISYAVISYAGSWFKKSLGIYV